MPRMAVQISTCYDGATAANQQESRRPGQEPGAWWLQGIILFVIFLPLSFQFSANPPVQRSFRCVRRRTFLGSNLTYYYSFALHENLESTPCFDVRQRRKGFQRRRKGPHGMFFSILVLVFYQRDHPLIIAESVPSYVSHRKKLPLLVETSNFYYVCASRALS